MTRKQITSRVKVHLLSGRSITPIECFKLFGGMRLADAIYNLREYGLKIDTEIVRLKDGGSYARYKLIKN